MENAIFNNITLILRIFKLLSSFILPSNFESSIARDKIPLF